MQATGMGINMIDTDNDGIPDSRPVPGTGTGMNTVDFVDVDNDGVCDTYLEGASQLLDGSGAQMANRGIRGGRQ